MTMTPTSEVVARLLTDAEYCALRMSPTVNRVGKDCAEAAALISSLVAENEAMATKVGHAQYAMDTVAKFVRPRIPTDQNPEQATSFFAWIGMILRLEQRAEVAERQRIEAERLLAEARERMTRLENTILRAHQRSNNWMHAVAIEALAIEEARTTLSTGGGNG